MLCPIGWQPIFTFVIRTRFISRRFVNLRITPRRAAALATGTKVKIDNYGRMRDGVSSASLAELAFAYMRHYGATKIEETPGKPQGFDETGSVSSAIPGIGFSAFTSNGTYHTYGMEADALTEVGHHGLLRGRRTGDDRVTYTIF